MRHIISVDTMIAVLGALFLCIPLIGGFPSDQSFIYWFGGFLVLGFFIALLARTFLAALLKGGILPAAITTTIFVGGVIYGGVFGPQTQNGSLGFTMFDLMVGLIAAFVGCSIAVMCGIAGSLAGFLLGKLFRSSGKRPETHVSMQDYNYPIYRQY